jgi:hypothetical protein
MHYQTDLFAEPLNPFELRALQGTRDPRETPRLRPFLGLVMFDTLSLKFHLVLAALAAHGNAALGGGIPDAHV